LGVVHPFFKFFLTDNPSKSFDFFELLLQTQPTTSTYIENYPTASSLVKTLKISSGEVFLTAHRFSQNVELTLLSSSTSGCSFVQLNAELCPWFSPTSLSFSPKPKFLKK
jgi:hypothetical protein